MDLSDATVPARATRRRGAALEAAILDAAWDVLRERGYSAFTMEAVAERAQTSRPVLYRRWPGRIELLRATLARRGRVQRAPTGEFDTGSLRGDLLAALREVNEARTDIVIVQGTALGDFYAETGTTPADLRQVIIGDSRPMQEILDRAVTRGEADPARLTDRVVATPFDLWRHEVLLTLRPVTDDWLAHVVDEIFLPLVRPTPPPH